LSIGGGGVVGLFHELIKLGAERAKTNLKKNLGLFGGGVQLEATFFITKISPNCKPKINPLTLSKGFFMNLFNNFNKKIEEKGVAPHISTIFSFNTIFFLKNLSFVL
jgi:hypothetical protein